MPSRFRTVNDLLNAHLVWLRGRVKSNTMSRIHLKNMQSRMNRMRPLVGHLLISRLSRGQMLKLEYQFCRLKSQRTGKVIGPREAIHMVQTFRSAVRWAYAIGFIDKDPFDGYRLMTRKPARKPVDDIPDASEFVRAVWGKVKKEDYETLDFSGRILLLALRWQQRSGMRTCEIVRVEWAQISRGQSALVYPGKTTRKTGKLRVVPLTPWHWRILRALPRHPSGRIFGWWSSTSALTKRLRKIEARHGEAGWRPYDLRRSFITTCLDAGLPARDVANLAGTSVAVIEESYDLQRFSRLRSSIDRVFPVKPRQK